MIIVIYPHQKGGLILHTLITMVNTDIFIEMKLSGIVYKNLITNTSLCLSRLLDSDAPC